ncbi:hypothetical protein BJ165DRAFT_1134207 [Panaeolus papilionaceus]|nr:hypothetical protein BJ165DRAFT_1134207 [Panaeolus papilionaceus]
MCSSTHLPAHYAHTMLIDTPGQLTQTPEPYYIQLSWVENWVIAAICSAFGSGLLVLLYTKCVVLVWTKQSHRSRGMRYFLLAYMTTLMSLSLIQTTMMSLVSVGSVRCFIAQVGRQHFPLEKAECSYCDTAEIVGQVCAGVVNWAMDGFMIWRCMVLYRDLPRFRRLALCIFAIVLCGASLTGGILCLVPSLAPGLISVNIRPWRPVAGPLSVFACVTLFTNIIFTALVSVRLWLHQPRLQELLGPNYGSIYRRIVVILLESAALVVVANITLIILLFLSLPSATPIACSVIHVYVSKITMHLLPVAPTDFKKGCVPSNYSLQDSQTTRCGDGSHQLQCYQTTRPMRSRTITT